MKNYKKNTQKNIVDVSKKDKGIISRNVSLRRSWSAIRKQKRDIEQMVTLSEAHLIIRLCAGEVLSRGLGEENLFSPVENEDNPDEVRYLINCHLRDNKTEFEDELKFQDIRNVVSGIRWTLRKCVTSVVSYKNYENFVRLESELQYDARKGIFNQFISNLSKPAQSILLELFELFSQVMTQSHINKIPPQRVIKSIAHYIIGDKELKFENFNAAYTKWLRCSNACTHLFLAYLRERACSASLPPRLNILLDSYVQFRKKSRQSPDYQHPLADITIGDLQLVIRPKKRRQKNNNIISSQINPIRNSGLSRQFDPTRNSGLSRQFDPTRNNNNIINRQIDSITNNNNNNERQSTLLNNRQSSSTAINNRQSSSTAINNRQTSSILLKSMLKNEPHESIISRGSLTIAEMFPDIAESLSTLRRKTAYQNLENIIEDQQIATQNWDELQIKGFNVLSEETLKLFFSYDDRSSNPGASIVRRRSRKFNKKTFDEKFLEMIPNIEIDNETLRDSFFQTGGNNSNVSIRATVFWDEFEKKGFRDSIDTNSNLFRLSSTLGQSTSSIPTSIGSSSEFPNSEIFNLEVTSIEVANTEVNNTEVNNTEVTSIKVANTEVNNTKVANTEVNNTKVTNTEVENTEVENTEIAISDINKPRSLHREIQTQPRKRIQPKNRQEIRKNKFFRKTFCFLCIRPGSTVSGFSVTLESSEEEQDASKEFPLNSQVTIEPINNNFPYMWVESNVNERNEKEPWEWVFVEPRDERHEAEWIVFEDKSKFLAEREKESVKRKTRKRSILKVISENLPWSKSNHNGEGSALISHDEYYPQDIYDDYIEDEDTILPYSKPNDDIFTYDEPPSPNINNIFFIGNNSTSSLAYNQEQYHEQSYVLASRRILQQTPYSQYNNYHT
ncbi:10452_t:CDS:2 [Scutellospora calospora]|uniref:10452_t:CDS:1 n=1 Tax=Scutellospora calospora TaxID=85575 RepID=A0ACA9JUS5_9GLOM|nr:10452_t:CDS:2 [Scutellospora calospora]